MKRILVLSLAAVTVAVPCASGAPIATTSYMGHSYELWKARGISWADASAAAIAGGGYLATLTDAAETAAVYGALIDNGFFTSTPPGSQAQSAWLGAYTTDPGFSTTDPQAWAWVTGEAWNAFAAGNFGGAEPNGDSSGLTINRFATSQWNDENGPVGGYIVEKARTHVPDAGSTMGMLGVALVLTGALVRRNRR
jgi:hypothetical protein